MYSVVQVTDADVVAMRTSVYTLVGCRVAGDAERHAQCGWHCLSFPRRIAAGLFLPSLISAYMVKGFRNFPTDLVLDNLICV
jgi:hypothetical protein